MAFTSRGGVGCCWVNSIKTENKHALLYLIQEITYQLCTVNCQMRAE